MALALNDRVQQTGTANTTVSFTLSGSVPGFQSFAVIGNGNTTYYSATDSSGNWEVGLGTYSTTGPTLTRTTILSSSNSNTAVTFSGVVNVFVTYPAEQSVNLDAAGNVSPLGTVSSGTWQGSTVGVAYGGTGVTTSSGANSVVLRDANQNVAVNRLNQTNTSTTAAGGVTALTAASSYIHTLAGTGNQTYTMPDATTLTTGVAFLFNNMATGTLTLQDFATGALGTIPSGGAGAVFLTINATAGGTWDLHSYLPEGVTWGTNALNLGTAIVSGGTWQGGTIQPAYGGTGLTTFVGANNALYSSGASTLTAGTLPIAAGGTGATTDSTARTNLGATTVGSNFFTLTNPSAVTFPRINLDNTVSALSASDFRTAIGAGTGSGTVTSVTGTSPVASSGGTTPAISLASGYGDTQNPYASKTANTFLAAPNGAAGVPTFRAVVAADIPTLNQNTTGSSGSCTGNAATATTATNQSGGTVSATTGVFTGLVTGATATTADINAANDTGSFSCRGNASFPASMSFHRTGVYAINMGLSTGNNFVIGGWSASSNAFSMTGAGALTMLNNITAYSDERVKTNWRDLPSDFIDQLAKVKHGIYDRTDQVSTQIGVGAQSLRPVMEHAVMEDENGNLSVAYGNAALVAAIELAKQVVELKKEIELLKAK
jgi:hypothetical protein